MRTDSVKLSTQAVSAARSLVAERYGAEYLPQTARVWEGKSRNAQEAHEAIRPAGEAFRTPEEIEGEVGGIDARLYDLIWKRTVASQMLDARHKSMTATFDCALAGGAQAELVARGRVVLFDGFLRAYVEGADEPEANGESAGRDQRDEKEVLLPPLRAGLDTLVAEARPSAHQTKPPARYTEAGIVQKLEELGIGRPSTYASIIGTIIDREYVVKRGSALVPTPLAFAVVQLMLELEPTLVDYSFTAEMEAKLDAIALGELERTAFLDNFYRGAEPGLHAIVTGRATQIDPKRVGTIPIGEHDGQPIALRVGRFGPYIERGEARASVPEGLAPDEITVDKALELLAAAGQAEEPIGHAPDGTPVFMRTGRFGPYVQLGEDTGDKKLKPKRASIFKSMDPRRLTVEQALLLLSLPRTLGVAADGGTVVARPGRFGPYLEKTTRRRREARDAQPQERGAAAHDHARGGAGAVRDPEARPRPGRRRRAAQGDGRRPGERGADRPQKRQLRPLRDRRHDQRLAAQGREGRGADPGRGGAPARRPARGGAGEEEAEERPQAGRAKEEVIRRRRGNRRASRADCGVLSLRTSIVLTSLRRWRPPLRATPSSRPFIKRPSSRTPGRSSRTCRPGTRGRPSPAPPRCS